MRLAGVLGICSISFLLFPQSGVNAAGSEAYAVAVVVPSVKIKEPDVIEIEMGDPTSSNEQLDDKLQLISQGMVEMSGESGRQFTFDVPTEVTAKLNQTRGPASDEAPTKVGDTSQGTSESIVSKLVASSSNGGKFDREGQDRILLKAARDVMESDLTPGRYVASFVVTIIF